MSASILTPALSPSSTPIPVSFIETDLTPKHFTALLNGLAQIHYPTAPTLTTTSYKGTTTTATPARKLNHSELLSAIFSSSSLSPPSQLSFLLSTLSSLSFYCILFNPDSSTLSSYLSSLCQPPLQPELIEAYVAWWKKEGNRVRESAAQQGSTAQRMRECKWRIDTVQQPQQESVQGAGEAVAIVELKLAQPIDSSRKVEATEAVIATADTDAALTPTAIEAAVRGVVGSSGSSLYQSKVVQFELSRKDVTYVLSELKEIQAHIDRLA